LHSLYLLAIISIGINNGAGFYFKVFAKRYYSELLAEEGDAEDPEEEEEEKEEDCEEGQYKDQEEDCEEGGL